MLREIWKLRHFWLALARHDVNERYRRSLLGIGWSLLKPAAMTTILTLIFSQVFTVSVEEYVPYLLLGLISWQFLAECSLQGCHAFRIGRTYLRVRPMPLAIFPLRVMLAAAVHAAVGLCGAIVLTWCLGGRIDLFAIARLLPALAILPIAGWALACITGVLHTFYSDMQQVAEIGLQVLFYATPVIYLPASLSPDSRLRLFIDYSPMASYLDLVRRPILHGEWSGNSTLLLALSMTTLLCAVAVYCIQKTERRLVLWL